MKLRKILHGILYGLFATAIVGVMIINLRIGNINVTALNLLSFNLEALSSESSGGESSGGASTVKCNQKYSVTSDPQNSPNCYSGSLYSNYSIMLHKYTCTDGANTATGCKTGTIKQGHDCSTQYFQTPAEALAEGNKLPCKSQCPKQ